MLPATIAICRKLCSLQAKQKRCSDLNEKFETVNQIDGAAFEKNDKKVLKTDKKSRCFTF